MSKYRNTVKKLQKIQLMLVVLCIVSIAAYFFFITRPKITGYAVQDECGPIGGTISHSINSQDACENACRAHCQSLKKELHDSKFELKGNECNFCDCYCKEERFI